MTNPAPRRRNTDTTAATAARRRGRKERLATELREAGWLVIPPENVHDWTPADPPHNDAAYRQAREAVAARRSGGA